jgi:hypothetical protein
MSWLVSFKTRDTSLREQQKGMGISVCTLSKYLSPVKFNICVLSAVVAEVNP